MTRAYQLAALVIVPTTFVLLSCFGCAPPRRVPGPAPAQASAGSSDPAASSAPSNHAAQAPDSQPSVFSDYAVVEPETTDGGGGPIQVNVVREAPSESAPAAGPFDAALVVRNLRAAGPSFASCARPGVEGHVTVQFEVVSGGAIAHVAAMRTTFDSLEVAECVVRQVAQLTFAPGPTGGSASFSYPILIPGNAPAGS